MWTPITDDLRTLDDELRLPGGVIFPVRATAMRLRDGAVWLHSPVRMSEAQAQALHAWGPVRHLVAPCALHHLFLGPATERFPEATVWAPASLPTKRPDLRIDAVLGRDPAPWADQIERVHLAGAPAIDEHVFFHRDSRSLLCADLLFHVLHPRNFATALVHRLVGTHRRLGQSRVWRLATRDRQANSAAARAVIAWRAERLVPCHGELLERDVPAQVEAALRWMSGPRPALTTG
jgi:hypothetical protein